MTEYYNLPVLFTEEERKQYAAWGIKKEKTLLPFAIIAAIIEVLGLTALVIYLLGVRSRGLIFPRTFPSGEISSAVCSLGQC